MWRSLQHRKSNSPIQRVYRTKNSLTFYSTKNSFIAFISWMFFILWFFVHFARVDIVYLFLSFSLLLLSTLPSTSPLPSQLNFLLTFSCLKLFHLNFMLRNFHFAFFISLIPLPTSLPPSIFLREFSFIFVLYPFYILTLFIPLSLFDSITRSFLPYLFVLHLYHSNLFSLQFPFSNFPFSVEFINFRFFLFLISSAPSVSIPSTLFPVSLPPSSH